MPFKFEMLWTDAAFFVLIMMGISALILQKRKGQGRTWAYIVRSKIGMSTCVILFFYLLIAFLDSIHFRMRIADTQLGIIYSAQLLSVLDYILSPLNTQLEITYTAPFANIPLQQIVLILISSVPTTLMLWFGSVSVIVLWTTRGKIMRMQSLLKTKICWRTLFITLAITLFIMVGLFYLSRYGHVLGTDKIGQDVFYQAVKSIRTSVLIGTLTTLVTLPFALLLGTLAGYFQGWVDDVIQYVYTTLNSIPSVLLIVASVLMLEVVINTHPQWFVTTAARADTRLFALCVILGITSWTSLCRLIRAETLKLRELDYVLAARALGVRHFSIILQHILPNLMHIILITIVLDFSGLVLAEAVLSYIGVGVDPSMQSFGNMINSARLELAREPVIWWSLTAAFVFMFILVLAANLFADTVRDALDPKAFKVEK